MEKAQELEKEQIDGKNKIIFFGMSFNVLWKTGHARMPDQLMVLEHISSQKLQILAGQSTTEVTESSFNGLLLEK